MHPQPFVLAGFTGWRELLHIAANFHYSPGFKAIAQARQHPEATRINDFYQVDDVHWQAAVNNADDRAWFRETAQ